MNAAALHYAMTKPVRGQGWPAGCR